jgi:Domain of unknown function (DUF4384)
LEKFMQRRKLIGRAAGLASVLAMTVLAGCASAPSGAVDVSLLQRMDAVMRQAAARLPVSLRLNTEQLTTGSPLQVEVAAPSAGFVYLFQLRTDGKALDMLFPNAVDGANFLAAGQRTPLPRANWRMSARGPAGVGYLMAVVTEVPQDLLALQAGLAAGKIELSAPYGAAMTALREVAP